MTVNEIDCIIDQKKEIFPMQTNLRIVLDQEGQISKVLETMELKELDIYIMENFKDSMDIRQSQKYKDQIDKFLEEYQSYRNKCQRKNNGRICITYTKEDGSLGFLKVRYQKDKEKRNSNKVLANIKRSLNENTHLLRDTLVVFNDLFSDFQKYEIIRGLRYQKPLAIKKALNDWGYTIQKRNDYYEILRFVDRFIEKQEPEKNKLVLSAKQGKVTVNPNVQIDQTKVGPAAIYDHQTIHFTREDHIKTDHGLLYVPLDEEELFSSTMDLDDYLKLVKEDPRNTRK